MMSHKKSRVLTTRALAVLAAAAIGLTGLAACGNDKPADPASSAATTADQEAPAATSGDDAPPVEPAAPGDAGPGVDDGTELTLWTRSPLERQANILVAAYNASHQNQIKLELVPNDDMEGKVGAAATNGELPDMLAGDVVRLPYWTANGMFTNINDQIDALGFADDIARGHIDAGTIDGVKHTLPFVTDISVMVWNKDLFTEAGLDPEHGPASLKEFKEQALAVADLKKEGVSGTYFGGACGGCLVFTWFPSIWASGAEVMNADGTVAELDSDVAKQVFGIYADLVAAGAVGAGSKEEDGATWTAPIAQGTTAVMPYPNTLVPGLIEDGLNIGVGPIPGLDGGQSTFLGGDAIGISKDSKNIDQAWNFLAWLMSDAAQIDVIAADGGVPCRKSMLDNSYTAADPIATAMNATVAYGRTPVATNFAEAFNAGTSPWVTLFRNAVFENGGATLTADNQAITDLLAE